MEQDGTIEGGAKFQTFPFFNFYATNFYPATGGVYYGFFSPTTLWSTSQSYVVGPKQVKHGRIPHGSRVVMLPSPLLPDARSFYESWRHAY